MEKIYYVAIEDEFDYRDNAIFTTFDIAYEECIKHIRTYYEGLDNLARLHRYGDEDFYCIEVTPIDDFKYPRLTYTIYPMNVNEPIAYMD